MTHLDETMTDFAAVFEQARSVFLPDVIQSSGVRLRPSGQRFTGPCPFGGHTGKNKANFSVYYNRDLDRWMYHCFSCRRHGDAIQWIVEQSSLEPVEAALSLVTGTAPVTTIVAPRPDPKKNKPLARNRAEQYHHNLAEHPQARRWWHDQGIEDATIAKYCLGYAPTFRLYNAETDTVTHTETYTIPVFEDGSLVSIRHRLAHAQGWDKYRPERTGDGAHLFNVDMLYQDAHEDVLILAGEKKAIYLDQEINLKRKPLYNTACLSATAGAQNWCGVYGEQWVPLLRNFRYKYILFDPGEEEAAQRTALLFGRYGRVVYLPMKPDDFVRSHGVAALYEYLVQARPVR